MLTDQAHSELALLLSDLRVWGERNFENLSQKDRQEFRRGVLILSDVYERSNPWLKPPPLPHPEDK